MPRKPENVLAIKVAIAGDKLNRLFIKAHKLGLVVNLQVDTKQLKFPIIAVSLLKPLDVKAKTKTKG